MIRLIRGNILVTFSNDLDLVYEKLRRISDYKIFSGEYLFPIIFDPGKKKILSNSVLCIDFDQATQSGLKNITVVIINPPLVKNLVELFDIKPPGSSAVKRLIVGEVGGTQNSQADRKYL